jgi:hypothetical protein
VLTSESAPGPGRHSRKTRAFGGARRCGIRGEMGGQGQAGSGEPIEMARRAPRLGFGGPGGLEHAAVSQSYKDRIHGAGFHAQLLTQVVAVAPDSGLLGKGLKDGRGETFLLCERRRRRGFQARYASCSQ